MKQHTVLHATLKERGHRITKARSVLLHLFFSAHSPLSAGEIVERLKHMDIAPNKTTIYRQLEFLVKENLVQELKLTSGTRHFELRALHHHHIVCKQCGAVEEIALAKLETLFPPTEEKITQKTGFKQVDHSLEFSGICEKCSK